MPEHPEERPLYDEFLHWLADRSQERGGIKTYELLTIVKAIVPQARMTLTPSELALALVHAASYMERWLVENEFMMIDLETNTPVRLETAEETRFGKNALAEVEDGWVPDELPDWLQEEG